MKEKLQVVATQLLEPETKDGPSSLLIVLGTPPREASVAYIVNSRAQIADLFQAIGPDMDKNQMQKILTAMKHFDSFPEKSEEQGMVLEDEEAQSALDAIDPFDDAFSEEMDEQEPTYLN